METKKLIQVDLEHFAKTSQLDPFSLGCSRLEIESILDRKFDYIFIDDLHILKCDGVVFRCHAEGPVHAIHVCIKNTALAAEIFDVKLGAFQPDITIKGVCSVLDRLNIRYGGIETYKLDRYHPFAITMMLENGVQLSFHRKGWFRSWSLAIVSVRNTIK